MAKLPKGIRRYIQNILSWTWVSSNCAKCVGISLPGNVDEKGRVLKLSLSLPGWIDVPMADWLEPRLNRKVTLADSQDCADFAKAWEAAENCLDDFHLSQGAARLAFERFTSSQVFPKTEQ